MGGRGPANRSQLPKIFASGRAVACLPGILPTSAQQRPVPCRHSRDAGVIPYSVTPNCHRRKPSWSVWSPMFCDTLRPPACPAFNS